MKSGCKSVSIRAPQSRAAFRVPQSGLSPRLKRARPGFWSVSTCPADIDAQRLMELGFLPGHTITRGHSAPGGDPQVFRVDGSGSSVARRETAIHLLLR